MTRDLSRERHALAQVPPELRPGEVIARALRIALGSPETEAAGEADAERAEAVMAALRGLGAEVVVHG